MSKTGVPSTNNLYAKVAVLNPVAFILDYLIPEELHLCSKDIGKRVKVPFGSREIVGVICEVATQASIHTEKIKNIIAVLDTEQLFPPTSFKLLAFAAKYYHYPLGLVFENALPKKLRLGETISYETVDKLSSSKSIQTIGNDITLNCEQARAFTQINSKLNQFNVFLLYGVTGSGKTEVYIHLIREVVNQGKQALVLIPEINLTPQTVTRFKERFNCPISLIHSKIAPKAKAVAWLGAKEGIAKIVIGTRQAVFTPLANPGIFIIDEEHDLSFKSQEKFRYSARDLLLKRAQVENCPVVLGSATPSLESYNHAKTGQYNLLKLTTRTNQEDLPLISMLDTRHNKLNGGLSAELISIIRHHLQNQGQVLLFLNRRGFAPVVMCPNCGWHQTCSRCSVNMVLHSFEKVMRCHHCLLQQPIPQRCLACDDPDITSVGVGTEQLAKVITNLFPDHSVSRIDRDTVSAKQKLDLELNNIITGKTNIIIGTQMLTKGHHFPHLTLVAIINTDQSLFSADYRAIERLGQLVTQVAGRPGRERKKGQVVIQTSNPEHPVFAKLLNQDYIVFLEDLLDTRKSCNLPPFCFQVLIRAEAKSKSLVKDFLDNCANFLANTSLEIMGPAPAPIEKKIGYFGMMLLIQSKKRGYLQQAMSELESYVSEFKIAKSLKWSLDFDPQEVV